MSKVLTFSRVFPSYHPRTGQPTNFVEKIWKAFVDTSPSLALEKHYPDMIDIFDVGIFEKCNKKFHTIRGGHRFKAGDMFSPRVWGADVNPVSGRRGPYHSKQIIIAPDIRVEKTWDIEIVRDKGVVKIDITGEDGVTHDAVWNLFAANDGLSDADIQSWFLLSPSFKKSGIFSGQIICWDSSINY